jgi:hypothetical protein
MRQILDKNINVTFLKKQALIEFSVESLEWGRNRGFWSFLQFVFIDSLLVRHVVKFILRVLIYLGEVHIYIYWIWDLEGEVNSIWDL